MHVCCMLHVWHLRSDLRQTLPLIIYLLTFGYEVVTPDPQKLQNSHVSTRGVRHGKSRVTVCQGVHNDKMLICIHVGF